MVDTERAPEFQQLADPVTARLGRDGNMMRMTLPPRAGFARMGYEPNPPSTCHDRVEGGSIARLGGDGEVVAPPQSANQSKRLSGRGPFRNCDHIVDVRISPQDALASPKYEDVERGLRKTLPDGAHERRGQQNIAEAP